MVLWARAMTRLLSDEDDTMMLANFRGAVAILSEPGRPATAKGDEGEPTEDQLAEASIT